MVTGLVGVLVIAVFSFVPFANAWTSGQGWGYKWVTDWDTGIKNVLDKNATFSGEANGKAANIVFIKYSGEKNGYYRFNFEGSYYTYGRLKGMFKYASNQMVSTSASINMDMKVKAFWIDYRGYLDIVKYQPGWGYPNSTCYGIQDMMISYYTKEPIDIYGEMSGHMTMGNQSMKVGSEYQLQGYISVTANINFDEPVPYLPANNTPSEMNPYIMANYSGVAELKTNGYAKITESTSPTSMQVEISLDTNVDKNLNGATYIFSEFSKNNTEFYRVGIPENIGFYALNIISISPESQKVDASMDNYLSALMDTNNRGIYDNRSSFYNTIVMSGGEPWVQTTGLMFSGNVFISGSSQPATEEEVKNVENKAPDIYGSYQENFLELLMDYLLYIIIGIVVAVAIVVPLIIVRRKKKANIQRRTITQKQISKMPYKPPQGEVKKSELEDKLKKLKELKDDGILTEEEYQSKKEELLRREGY